MKGIAAALASLFAVKLLVAFQLAGHPLLQPGGGLDSDYYHQLAQRVLAGDLLLGPGLYFVSPLYIYFLAMALAAGGGSLLFAKIAQVALGTAACGLVWLTARAWFGTRAAWIALVLAALTGVFTFYEALILQAALDPFLTALDLWLLTMALQRSSVRWPLLAGAAFALHALNRPNMLLVAAGLALLLFARPRSRGRPALAFLLGLALGFAPVTVRNHIAAGAFTPVPSHGGLNLYIGNNPRADGTYRSVEGITPNIAGQAEDARRVAEAAEGRALTDAEVSAHFTRRALAWVATEPLAALRLFVRKVAYTLNATFLTLNYSYPFYRHESSVLRMLFVGPLLLVPLGLCGLFAHRLGDAPTPPGFAVWAASVPLLIASIAVFFVASRYRLPLLVPLCICAGGFVGALPEALAARRRPLGIVAVLVLLPAAALAAWDFGLDDGRAEEETRMAVWAAANGRVADAERYASQSERTPATAGVSHFRVGQACERAGNLAAAIQHYTRATEIDPDERAPRVALARASGRFGVQLAQQNRDAEALPLLEQAARLAPDDAAAQLNLAVQLGRMERYADARAAADKALRIDPEYARARQFLAALDRLQK